jgi:hypothetical protein
MSAMNWRKLGVYVLVVVPALGLGGIAVIAAQQDTSTQQSGVPVADAARKARDQKKAEAKPKKVYTNEDLGGGSGSTAPATGSAPAAAAPAGTAPAATDSKDGATPQSSGGDAGAAKPAASNKNDEASWRKRFSETRGKLANAQKELDILQREAQKAQVQYYSDPTKAMKEQYSRKDVTDKDTKIAAKKQEIDQLTQQLSDMEDELRRSGGDNGWARE